jgi:preprotein translocase subunit SecG
MYQILVIISIIVCVLLVAIVLIQNPKGGGLASGFSSSSQMMGVQRTGDFLEKGTWGLAIFLMVLALAINVAVKGGTDQTEQKHYNITTKGATQAPVTPQPTQKQQQPLTPLNPATGKTK